MRTKKRTIILKTILAWILSLIIIAPVLVVIFSSLKSTQEAAHMNLSLPSAIKWENFAEAIKRGGLVKSFFNSLLISSFSAAISLYSSAMAAFVMARRQSKLNKTIFNFIFLGLIAPLNYVATIKFFQILGLYNSYIGIILLNASLGIPFAVFVYYGFMSSIPKELDEAAIIDGCSSLTLFFKVIFPLLKPVTMTVLVLNFMGAWNDFISPLYLLSSSKKWPMVMSIYNFFGSHFNEWNMICAVIVLSVIPIMVLYIAGQNYIVSGMTSGAVKQ